MAKAADMQYRRREAADAIQFNGDNESDVMEWLQYREIGRRWKNEGKVDEIYANGHRVYNGQWIVLENGRCRVEDDLTFQSMYERVR